MKRARNAKRARWGSGTHQGTPAEFARAAHTCSVATTISTMKAEAISPMFCDGAAAARFSRAFATGGMVARERELEARERDLEARVRAWQEEQDERLALRETERGKGAGVRANCRMCWNQLACWHPMKHGMGASF